MKYKSLQTELMVNILGVTLLVMAITLAIISYYSNNAAKKSARETSRLTAENITKDVAGYFEKPFETLHNLSLSFNSLKQNGIKNREVYRDILKEALTLNDNYLALWAMYEPNMLDGEDSKYLRTGIYDEEGRFNVSLYKQNGQIKIELGQVSMYDEDYYKIPFSTGTESLLEPYFYKYGGDNTEYFETSIAQPLKENGKAIGVIGLDINLKELSESLKDDKVYETGYIFIASNEGVIAAHPVS